MLTKVNGRITALTNVLCSADAPDSIKTAITGVGGGSGRVDVKAKILGDSLYLIAAIVLNMTGASDSQQVTFNVPNALSPVAALFEKRNLTLSGNAFSDGFGLRSSVRVYAMKIGPASVSDNGGRRNRPLFPNSPERAVFDMRGGVVDSKAYRTARAGIYIVKDDHGRIVLTNSMR